jgi:hypothetical protein
MMNTIPHPEQITKARRKHPTFPLDSFLRDLAEVLNRHGFDNDLEVPDYLLAEYVFGNLQELKALRIKVEKWKGKS